MRPAELLVRELREALDDFDHNRAEVLCSELIAQVRHLDGPFPREPARRVLGLLRRSRNFPLMQQVGDAYIQGGQLDAQVRRQYVQALIDQGHITAALAIVDALLADPALDPAERPQIHGLQGRACKQLYVTFGDSAARRRRDVLHRGIEAYYTAYVASPEQRLWPGINVVALLSRGRRDGIRIAGPEPGELAREILQIIETRHLENRTTPWDDAIAMEACIALGRADEAVKWAQRYAANPSHDAFAIAGTIRQLREVWQLDATDELGSLLLPLLQATLLKRERSELRAGADELSLQHLDRLRENGGLEKVFGFDEFVTYKWYRLGLERCQNVARVETKTGRPQGTGFVVRGSDLHELFGDELLLLTNAHVLSDNPADGAALRPEQAAIRFESRGEAASKEYRVDKILWNSPPSRLDATLARPAPAITDSQPYPISRELPPLRGRQRLYIIGHPRGGGLSLSIHDNLLLDYESPRIHYRTPTEPGSSGSPVFNDEWDLIALHHSGSALMPCLNGKSGTYEANEGILVQAIAAALATAPPALMSAGGGP